MKNKNEKWSHDGVTEKVSDLSSQGIIIYNKINYINISVYSDIAETAVVSGKVSELPDEQYLLPRRSPSSILGHGVSAFFQKYFIKISELINYLNYLKRRDI